MIKLPDDALANESNLEEVWTDTSLDQVALVFDSTVTILMQPNPYEDPEAAYKDSIDNGDAAKSLITVRGHPGLGIEPKTDAFESNPSWIEFVEDDVSIVLESPTQTVSDLERVAESMA